jgi:hypothetical protein
MDKVTVAPVGRFRRPRRRRSLIGVSTPAGISPDSTTGTRLPVSLAGRVGAGAEGYDWAAAAAAAAPGSLADQSAQWAIDTFPSTGWGLAHRRPGACRRKLTNGLERSVQGLPLRAGDAVAGLRRGRPGGSSRVRGPDRANDLARTAAFHQEADGPGVPGGSYDAAADVRAEHQHVGAGSLLREDVGRLEPGHVRHGHVHQDDVRAELRSEREGIVTVDGFSDDQHLAGRDQQTGQGSTDSSVVVDDENTDRRGHDGNPLSPASVLHARRDALSRREQRDRHASNGPPPGWRFAAACPGVACVVFRAVTAGINLPPHSVRRRGPPQANGP